MSKRRNNQVGHRKPQGIEAGVTDATAHLRGPSQEEWEIFDELRSGNDPEVEAQWIEFDKFRAKRSANRRLIDAYVRYQDLGYSVITSASTVPTKKPRIVNGNIVPAFKAEDWFERKGIPRDLIDVAMSTKKASVDRNNQPVQQYTAILPVIGRYMYRQAKKGSVQEATPEGPVDLVSRESRIANIHSSLAKFALNRFGFRMKEWGQER